MSPPETRQVTFPSPGLPAPVPFRLSVPVAWDVRPAPGVFLLARDLEKRGGFQANVVVSWDRVSGSVRLSDLVQQLWSETEAAFADVELDQEKTVEIAGTPAVLRAYNFDDAALGRRLFQVGLYALVPCRDADVADAIQMHATCAAEDAEGYAPTFLETMNSLQFSPLP